MRTSLVEQKKKEKFFWQWQMQKMLEHDLHWDEFFSELVYDILRPFYKKRTLRKWTWGFLRRTQKFEEISKLRGKFLQILGSSQNIWMLRKCVVKTQVNLNQNTFSEMISLQNFVNRGGLELITYRQAYIRYAFRNPTYIL